MGARTDQPANTMPNSVYRVLGNILSILQLISAFAASRIMRYPMVDLARIQLISHTQALFPKSKDHCLGDGFSGVEDSENFFFKLHSIGKQPA